MSVPQGPITALLPRPATISKEGTAAFPSAVRPTTAKCPTRKLDSHTNVQFVTTFILQKKDLISDPSPCPLQALWADQLSKLPGVSKLSSENHLLLPQLPVQHRHPCSDLPHRTLPRLLRRQRHRQHHAGKWGKLLQHQEAECLHRCCVLAPAGWGSERFPNYCGDEALETGDVYHFPGQDLRLHHSQPALTAGADLWPLWTLTQLMRTFHITI